MVLRRSLASGFKTNLWLVVAAPAKAPATRSSVSSADRDGASRAEASERGFEPVEDVDSAVAWPLPIRPGPQGLHLETSLSQLITEVILSPTTATWFPDELRDTIGKYGYNFSVRQSTLH